MPGGEQSVSARAPCMLVGKVQIGDARGERKEGRIRAPVYEMNRVQHDISCNASNFKDHAFNPNCSHLRNAD